MFATACSSLSTKAVGWHARHQYLAKLDTSCQVLEARRAGRGSGSRSGRVAEPDGVGVLDRLEQVVASFEVGPVAGAGAGPAVGTGTPTTRAGHRSVRRTAGWLLSIVAGWSGASPGTTCPHRGCGGSNVTNRVHGHRGGVVVHLVGVHCELGDQIGDREGESSATELSGSSSATETRTSSARAGSPE